MDPLTISSLLAVAAGALGSEAVKDLYETTKQRTLQRQLEKYDLSQNQKLLEHLTKLEALLSEK